MGWQNHIPMISGFISSVKRWYEFRSDSLSDSRIIIILIYERSSLFRWMTSKKMVESLNRAIVHHSVAVLFLNMWWIWHSVRPTGRQTDRQTAAAKHCDTCLLPFIVVIIAELLSFCLSGVFITEEEDEEEEEEEEGKEEEVVVVSIMIGQYGISINWPHIHVNIVGSRDTSSSLSDFRNQF